MPRMIFVNLPVKDLPASMAFWRALGFDFNPDYTDETAACLVISDQIFAMLLTHPRFAEFALSDITDARKAREVLVALSTESRDELDRLVAQAVTSGGALHGSARDYGFMYQQAITDPDGHVWELVHMDQA